MPIVTSNRFGGSPTRGDVASEPGQDLFLLIPPDYIIHRIIATYAIAGGQGAGPADYQSVRSFTGRCTVITGELTEQITGIGGFQPLSDLLPESLRKDRFPFDVLMNGFDGLGNSRTFDFANGPDDFGAVASVAGGPLTVCLFAGATFSGLGVRQFNTVQMLHVWARRIATGEALMATGTGENRRVAKY